MLLFYRVLFALLLLSSSAAVAGENGLSLAANGATQFTIVRPIDASPSQVYAAEELQRFTKEMTGAELPIVADDQPLPAKAILLGITRHTQAVLGQTPDLADLGDDGFRIVTRPPHLMIIGSPVRGTLYGVYELLEKYGGCRWYAKHHSRIPKLDSWTIPQLDETQTPAFAMREPFWWGMFDGGFAARCKVNGNRPELQEKHGGKIRFGGGLFVHTFYPLMPPDEFFAEHPEYYSELSGKRTTERAQLCLTNPDVVRIVTERVLARIRQDPQAKLFSVSQNDWAGWCQCPKCREIDEREGSPSGTMIHFVNQVAEAVEKEFPDVWIETLAYQYTRHPPKTLKPRHNVVPRLCTIECDFSTPLDVSTFEQNRKFVEDIEGWSAITDKLYVWDYTTNFGHYVSPHPNFGCLQGNVQFFRDHHVVGLFEQGAYQAPHAEFAELRAWILAKLLWNPDQDVEPLYRDFFEGYYGPAAGPIRQYFDELQALVKPDENVLQIWNPPTAPYYTDAFFDRAAKLWTEAEALVKDDPALSYNVRMSSLPVIYARLMRWPATTIALEDRDGVLTPVGIAPEYGRLARKFLAGIAEGGITYISESHERHTDFLAKLNKQLEVCPPAPQAQADRRPADRLVVEDRMMSLGREGEWGQRVPDGEAEDGSAVKLFNTHYEWCLSWHVNPTVFEPGAKYKLRMRVRVVKAGREGSAFWAGVYDTARKKGWGQIQPGTAEVEEGYQWYNVATWTPEAEQYLWVGPGPFNKDGGQSAIEAVYVDRFELTRAE
ncbi:MAG: DUF4838 domain-containing protein [Planctomycetaceae bacterium]|nr:DUF4838 domain-containing protein [Planctomycetaceae bacterium]